MNIGSRDDVSRELRLDEHSHLRPQLWRSGYHLIMTTIDPRDDERGHLAEDVGMSDEDFADATGDDRASEAPDVSPPPPPD